MGPDGTVQMCYVTFKLGNLHQNRLSELLHTPQHDKAAKDAYALNCPNCNCGYDKRVRTLADSKLLSNADRALLNTYGVNGGGPGEAYGISVQRGDVLARSRRCCVRPR